MVIVEFSYCVAQYITTYCQETVNKIYDINKQYNLMYLHVKIIIQTVWTCLRTKADYTQQSQR